jgi:hypothetical protein
VASSGADGAVRLWDVRLGSWRARACKLAGRDLSPEEWATYLGDEPYRATCRADHEVSATAAMLDSRTRQAMPERGGRTG